MNGGLYPGRLTIIAGKSGKGKSSLGLQIARHAANLGTVLFVSVEMSRRELFERGELLAAEAGVSYRAIQTGVLSAEGKTRCEEKLEVLTQLPIRIPEQRAHTAEDVCAPRWARRFHESGDLVLVAVDYIGILRVSKYTSNREQQVNHSTILLKQLAAELRVPVLAMSQVNDAGEVRDSRAVEHHCDSLLFVEPSEERRQDGLVDLTITVRKGTTAAPARHQPCGNSLCS